MSKRGGDATVPSRLKDTRTLMLTLSLGSTPSDSVTLMLFHDAVLMAVDGVGKTLVPVGPPNRYEEIAGHAKVMLWACKPCVDARGLVPASLDRRVKLGGMNDFHAAAKADDTKVVSF